MLRSLFQSAQSVVEGSVEELGRRLIVVAFIVVAACFATAALAGWLYREFPAEQANLLLAGVFVLLGALTSLAFNTRRDQSAIIEQATEPAERASVSSAVAPDTNTSALGASERELVMSALSAAGPLALPSIVRLGVKNWPIVLALIAAVYLLTDTAEDQMETGAPPEAAE